MEVNIETNEAIMRFQENHPEFVDIFEIHKSLKEKYIDITEDIQEDSVWLVLFNKLWEYVKDLYLVITVDVLVNHENSKNPTQ